MGDKCLPFAPLLLCAWCIGGLLWIKGGGYGIFDSHPPFLPLLPGLFFLLTSLPRMMKVKGKDIYWTKMPMVAVFSGQKKRIQSQTVRINSYSGIYFQKSGDKIDERSQTYERPLIDAPPHSFFFPMMALFFFWLPSYCHTGVNSRRLRCSMVCFQICPRQAEGVLQSLRIPPLQADSKWSSWFRSMEFAISTVSLNKFLT